MSVEEPRTWPQFQLAGKLDHLPTAGEPTGYLWERKLDGIRGMVSADRIKTRGQFYPSGFSVPPGWLLDGEIVVKDGHFSDARPAIVRQQWDLLDFKPFDALVCPDDPELHEKPLGRRLVAMLAAGLYDTSLLYAEPAKPFPGEPPEEWEGLIRKNISAPYSPRRSMSWLKWKRVQEVEAYILGFEPGTGGWKSGIGRIIFGLKNEQGKIIFAGTVGSGLDEQIRTEMTSSPRDFIGRPFTLRYFGWNKSRVRNPVFRGMK